MPAVTKPMSKPKYKCQYCGSKFTYEKTLATHMCVKKQRYLDIETTGSRIGFRAFQRMYSITTNAKQEKTVDEFIHSSLYLDFVRFGNYVSGLHPLFPDKFVDFLIRNGVKLNEWCREEVYYLYISDLLKREPATSAVERSFETIIDWCEKNSRNFVNFFSDVSANELAHLIRIGRISPWVVYLSSSGSSVIPKFNEDHINMIGDTIDPGTWHRRFKTSRADVDYISNILSEAGL